MDSDEREGREQAAEFAEKLKLTHRILVGGAQVADRYEFENTLPTSFWIDGQRKVVLRETGFRPEMGKWMERTIEGLLPKEAPAAPGRAPPAEASTKQKENP